jgi:D-aminoacyl-tRNA deacylase
MIALIQRVQKAQVEVNNEVVGKIDRGILALIGVQKDDAEKDIERTVERLLGYRIFEDEAGKMNLSLQDIRGGLLLVSQFTLAADTNKGMRASFTSAAPPAHAQLIFENLVKRARGVYQIVQTGRFGANMQVHLINDGPVTFWLET